MNQSIKHYKNMRDSFTLRETEEEPEEEDEDSDEDEDNDLIPA